MKLLLILFLYEVFALHISFSEQQAYIGFQDQGTADRYIVWVNEQHVGDTIGWDQLSVVLSDRKVKDYKVRLPLKGSCWEVRIAGYSDTLSAPVILSEIKVVCDRSYP